MPLDPEFIKQLQAKKNKPRGGGGRRTKSKIDPDDRTYQAWFMHNHMLIDHDTNDMLWCSNENCVDTRDNPYGQTVVEVNGNLMCRYCFLDGWLVKNPAQTVLTDQAG